MLKNQLARCPLRLAALALLLGVVLFTNSPSSAQIKGQPKGKQPDFIPAGYDDYQNMLDQLGIKKTRKGHSSGKDAPDDATANQYKDTMPELMTFKDGSKVTSADQWPKRPRTSPR
jgi:hypothetical protein